MQQGTCPNNCNVQFLSELWLCTLQGCTQPPLRCKQCFKFFHSSIDQLGKYRTHTHTPFDQSPSYKPFLYLIRLYELITHKYTKQFKKINKNIEYISWQIFSTSDLAKYFLTPNCMTQFYGLKQLYYNRPPYFVISPTVQLINSFNLFSQKFFNSFRSLLLESTEEDDHLAYYFNQASDSNPQALELFINNQQDVFTNYCDQIRQKNGEFDIKQYIKTRRQSPQIDKSYFTKMFQLFLIQKYSQSPQKQTLFTPQQYLSYAWQNLQNFSEVPQTSQYLDEWVQNYKQFADYMKSKNLRSTLLAFRMWKNHVPVSKDIKDKQKDKYFLDNFILAYIEHVIYVGLWNVGKQNDGGWRQFIKYLRDFVDACKMKGQQFVDISKLKSQDMITHIQKSTQISYNSQICRQFLNKTYNDGNMITLKNYKKFLQLKTQQQKQKQKQLTELCLKLEQDLLNEENQKFYKIIFNDYIKVCLQDKIIPNKDQYRQFKKSVLQRFDQEDIKLENDRLLLMAKEIMEGKKEKEGEDGKDGKDGKEERQVKREVTVQKNKQVKTKIVHNIDADEQNLAQEINSEEGEQTICPCCNGQPQDCDKPECQMIGYCVACNL